MSEVFSLRDLKILLDELENVHSNLCTDKIFYIDVEGVISLGSDYSALQVIKNHLINIRKEKVYFSFGAKKDYFNVVEKEILNSMNKFLKFIDTIEYSMSEENKNKLSSLNFSDFYVYFFGENINHIAVNYKNQNDFIDQLEKVKSSLYEKSLNIKVTLSSGYIFVRPKGSWFEELKEIYKFSNEELLSRKIRIRVGIDFYIYVRSLNLF